MLRRVLGPSLFLALALWLLQAALHPGMIPGTALSEAWGRLFVTAQVQRWVLGQAPPGWSDLLNYPDGQAFWPVDPVVQAVSVPLRLALGDLAAFTAVAVLLLWIAGLGPYVLARTLGAGRAGATAAGLLVQLSPFLLRNLHDVVLEVVAIGVLALAAAAIARAVQHPALTHDLHAGLGIFALAGSSPYFAVYLAIACALGAAATPSRWRSWLRIGAVGAVVCALAGLPFLLTEGGTHGRLGPAYRGGYHPRPTVLVQATDGHTASRAQLTSLRRSEPPALHTARPDRPAAPPSPLKRAALRVPGGVTVALGVLLALILPGARRIAALGLVFFFGGPGLPLLGRLLSLPVVDTAGPLERLLSALPLTGSMGNPTRMIAAYVLAGAVAAGVTTLRRPWLAGLLGIVALIEASLHLHAFILPASQVSIEDTVITSLTGPTVVFPSGDPPEWVPSVAPKETLFIAGRAGVPVASDYGRGRLPTDTAIQVRLATAAQTVIGREAWRGAATAPTAPFRQVLVLEDRLPAQAVQRLHGWLEAHGRLLRQGDRSSAWELTAD